MILFRLFYTYPQAGKKKAALKKGQPGSCFSDDQVLLLESSLFFTGLNSHNKKSGTEISKINAYEKLQLRRGIK